MRIAVASLICMLGCSAVLGAGETPATQPAPFKPTPLEGKGYITMNAKGGAIEFLRDGKPYYIKGVGGQSRLDLAAESGANSTRTWDSGNAKGVLDGAAKLGMTVTMGIGLDKNPAQYKNDGYKAGMRKKVEQLANAVKDHPAMLIYGLGNEINMEADAPETWAFINELAEILHKVDPNHPTMTVLAGSSTKTIGNVVRYAPSIDILGINTYGGIVTAPRDAESAFRGPYVITEWGPRGHWETNSTAWGAPLEQTSTEKMKAYASSYEIITSHKARCLGSYVFLWGQKQERTPTWYGMFIENNKGEYKGEALPTVDVMTLAWSGKTPENLAPAINDVRINGKGNIRMFQTTEGSTLSIGVAASDANNDTLTSKFEVMAEATQLGNGGSFEGRPKSFPDAIKKGENGSATLTVPAKGNYRLFVYVFDGKGKVSAMNIPFQVK